MVRAATNKQNSATTARTIRPVIPTLRSYSVTSAVAPRISTTSTRLPTSIT